MSYASEGADFKGDNILTLWKDGMKEGESKVGSTYHQQERNRVKSDYGNRAWNRSSHTPWWAYKLVQFGII